MKTKRFTMIASSYLILVKQEQVLLMKRKNTGYQDGKWGLCSGHVEDNETLTKAMIREAKEELSIYIDASNLSLVHVMHRKEKDIRLDFFFLCSNWKGVPENAEPEKCSDISWFLLDHLPQNTIGYIKAAIKNYQNGVFYSERF